MMRLRIAGIILVVFLAVPAWAQSTNQLYMTGTGSGSTPTIFSNGVDTNINMALVPKGTGGVGIGTTAPLAKLHIYGDDSSVPNAEIWFTNTGTNGRTWRIGDGAYTNNGNFAISDSTQGAARLLITSTGSVGIGTTAPTAQLHVVNSAAGNTGYAGYFVNTGTNAINYGLFATTSSTTGYAGYFQGPINVTGTVFTSLLTLSSDRRLKRNIRSLDTEIALDNVATLRPVAFEWRKTGKPDMGVIAQELASVYPDLVAHGTDHRFSVEYISLIAPLIASVQELKKREEVLEQENADFRREFDAYKEAHP